MFSDVDKSLKIDNKGNVVVLKDEAAIRQAIELNIAALRGEYVRSLRGSDLLRFVGRPFTDSNSVLLRQEIENIIANIDDRITNYYVAVNPNVDAGTYDISIQIEVTFRQTPFTINTRIRNTSA
jgi:phage baseplate assembly protein W